METKKKRRFHQYSGKNLELALQEVRNGSKAREVWRQEPLYRTVLREGFWEKSGQMGPDPGLKLNNEKKNC